MSWICEYCSTTNENRDKKCFVCGTERSKESIQEAKRAVREKRARQTHAIIYKSATITAKVLCVSSIVLFSIIAVIILYLKMKNGSLGDLLDVGFAITKNIGENFRLLFVENIRLMVIRLLNSPIMYIGSNFETVCFHMLHILQSNIEGITSELFVYRSIKYEAAIQRLVLLKDTIVEAFQLWWTEMVLLIGNIRDNIVSTVKNVEEMLQKFKESFLKIKNR